MYKLKSNDERGVFGSINRWGQGDRHAYICEISMGKSFFVLACFFKFLLLLLLLLLLLCGSVYLSMSRHDYVKSGRLAVTEKTKPITIYLHI